MRPTSNPFTSFINAIAAWLSLLPLMTVLQGREFLVESGILIAVVGALGLACALSRMSRGTTFGLQLLAVLGVVLWRATALAPQQSLPEALISLSSAGAEAISKQAPPLPTPPGLTFLVLLLAAVIVVALELLARLLEEPTWSFAPLTLSFVIALIASSAPLPTWHFAVVAAAYVAVLVTNSGIGSGHRTAGASRTVPFHATRIGLAAVMTAVAIAGSISLLPLVPMSDEQPWQGNNNGPIELGDPTVTLNENLLRPEDTPVLSYRTADERPVYFRTVALPDLTAEGARLVPMKLRSGGLDRVYEAPGTKLETTVQMRDVPSEYLPAPFAVDSIKAKGSWSYDPQTLTIVASGKERREQTRGLEYSVSSTVPSPSRDELAQAQAGADVDPITLSVPNVDARVRNLTQELTAEASTAGEKALEIQKFLRSDRFSYSLEAPRTATTDVISQFVLTDRKGYCIHFTSAMMTMARIEGIPARMAIGFNPGTPQPDGSRLVTSHNMHAWPELYFEGLGWVPFEPTPAVASPPGYTDPDPQGTPPPQTPTPSPSPSASTNTAPEPSPSPSSEPAPGSSPSPSPSPGPGNAGPQGLPSWLVPLIGSLLGLALLAVLPWLIRLALTRWRLRPSQEPKRLAMGAWREVQAMFADAGIAWPGGSPGPAARSAAVQSGAGQEVMEVAGIVERALFSPTTPDVRALPDQVAALRRHMAERAPRWWRVWPRSLWRRRPSA